MSYQAVKWVFENSKTETVQRLIMLAIAEHADKDGDNSWPNLDTLAKFANVTRRRLCRNLAELKKCGELEVEEGGGKGKSNHYRIKMDLSNSVTSDTVSNTPNSVTGGSNSVTGGIQTVSPVTPEPYEQYGTTKRGAAARVGCATGVAPILPFRSREFEQAWQDWQSHMKDKKKAMGSTQAKAILANLAKMTEGAAILAIEHSIRAGYPAIYPAPEPQAPKAEPSTKDMLKTGAAKNFRL